MAGLCVLNRMHKVLLFSPFLFSRTTLSWILFIGLSGDTCIYSCSSFSLPPLSLSLSLSNSHTYTHVHTNTGVCIHTLSGHGVIYPGAKAERWWRWHCPPLKSNWSLWVPTHTSNGSPYHLDKKHIRTFDSDTSGQSRLHLFSTRAAA